MPEKIMYDDGSYTIIDDAGNQGAWDIYGLKHSVVNADGQYFENPAYGAGQWAQDQREAEKIGQFYPNNGKPWWENLATYGVTKAIDSHFGQAAANKTMTGATYAGANGKTYGPGVAGGMAGVNPLIWLVLGAGVIYALASD